MLRDYQLECLDHHPQTLTRGEASNLISAFFAQKTLNKRDSLVATH